MKKKRLLPQRTQALSVPPLLRRRLSLPPRAAAQWLGPCVGRPPTHRRNRVAAMAAAMAALSSPDVAAHQTAVPAA